METAYSKGRKIQYPPALLQSQRYCYRRLFSNLVAGTGIQELACLCQYELTPAQVSQRYCYCRFFSKLVAGTGTQELGYHRQYGLSLAQVGTVELDERHCPNILLALRAKTNQKQTINHNQY
jgi:hypothetical protein